MNMVMATGQIGAKASPSANAGPQAGGKASGGAGGFAGALVQAITGEAKGTAQTPQNGMPLTADVASLIGQAQTQQSDAAMGTDLVAMLGKLLEQLQAQAGKASASSSDDEAANDPKAELLASLQDLLAQMNLLQLPSLNDGNASDATSALPVTGGGQTATLATLMPLLLQALKQASQSGATDANQPGSFAQSIEDLAQKMQQALAAGTAQTAAAQPQEQAKDSAISQTANALQYTAASDSQPAAVVASAEPRKATAAFKEPIVHWNLANDAAASEQPADVPVVTAASDTQSSSDQQTPLGMTLQQNPIQQSADAGKTAALPAQVPVQQFTEQVGNYLVKQFTLSGGNGVAMAKLSLHPDHLGQVDIRIVMQDGQMTAQFVAHNGTAKELLENQMSLLRTALQGQGIQVEKMDVVQQSDLNGSAAFLGQEQGGSGSGRDGGQASKRQRDGIYEEPVNFEAEMERTSVLREAGYGSAINVTA